MSEKYFELPAINPQYLRKQEYFLLFESSLCGKDNFRSFIFADPIDTIEALDYREVKEAFKRIEEYSKRYYLAGYFSYELGYYFEGDVFKGIRGYPYPLIQLCVFEKALTFNHKTGKIDTNLSGLFAEGKKQTYRLNNLRLSFTKPLYLKKISQIKSYIRGGSTYQVNFTGKYRFNFSGSPLALYQDLKVNQNTPYGAFCKFKDDYIISLSPELYFKREGCDIYTKPIKGTISRGKDIEEDREKIAQLKTSVKDLAENLMIVDLIRNDLGRISRVSSVRVTDLFAVEKYNTLFQLTSTVKGRLREGITYFDIFSNLFPGGSVTGAPKIRTMQIIRELEQGYRRVYCGALGMIQPKGHAVFNLPIRTVCLCGNKAEMGIGSGIVIDSLAEKEFQECSLKAKFLRERNKDFQLIETLLWENKYSFLRDHLRRMAHSAEYFNFYFNPQEAISDLRGIEKEFLKNRRYKVRLLLRKDGELQLEYAGLVSEAAGPEKLVALSRHRIEPTRIWFYHKTTNRDLYESEYAHYHQKGYYEVAFLNTRNEFTEGSFSNIIVQSGGRFYTPPVSSGLLPGIFRGYLLKEGKVEEKIIGFKDLERAEKLYLCNSVRGLTEVKIKSKKFK